MVKVFIEKYDSAGVKFAENGGHDEVFPVLSNPQ